MKIICAVCGCHMVYSDYANYWYCDSCGSRGPNGDDTGNKCFSLMLVARGYAEILKEENKKLEQKKADWNKI